MQGNSRLPLLERKRPEEFELANLLCAYGKGPNSRFLDADDHFGDHSCPYVDLHASRGTLSASSRKKVVLSQRGVSGAQVRRQCRNYQRALSGVRSRIQRVLLNCLWWGIGCSS